MTKKGFLKAAVIGLLFVGLAANASAQITISGSVAPGEYNKSGGR